MYQFDKPHTTILNLNLSQTELRVIASRLEKSSTQPGMTLWHASTQSNMTIGTDGFTEFGYSLKSGNSPRIKRLAS